MSNSPITLVGNLTADPELRFTTGGKGKVSFGLAVDRSYQVNGEWQTETSFFNIIAWDPVASQAANVITKGTRVILHGRLAQRSYEKDGEKRQVVEVVADEIGIVTRIIESWERKARQENGQGGGAASRPAAQSRPAALIDDEPF